VTHSVAQQGIGATSGLRETQVEKHCSNVMFILIAFSVLNKLSLKKTFNNSSVRENSFVNKVLYKTEKSSDYYTKKARSDM